MALSSYSSGQKKMLILVAELQLWQQCMHKKPHKLSIFLFFDSLFRVRYV